MLVSFVLIQAFICGYGQTEYYPWPGPLEIPDDNRTFIRCEIIQ